MTRADVAIVGAGLAGLGAALALHRGGVRDVVVLEKSRGLGGRLATRRRDGFTYDHGAQYLAGGSPTLDALRGTLGLVGVEKPVWLFDAAGRVAPGDPVRNAEARWVHPEGLSGVAKGLARLAGADVRRGTRVARVVRDGGELACVADDGGVVRAAAVVLAVPAPQAADVLEASAALGPRAARARTAVGDAAYRACIAGIFGVPRWTRDDAYHALLNVDGAHDVGWIGLEHAKCAGRAPAGAGLVVVQMGAAWSARHVDAVPADLLPGIAAAGSAVLGVDLHEAAWSDVQRWRYSQPTRLAAPGTLNVDPEGLWLAGDFAVGGRGPLALEHGVAVGRALLAG